MAAEEQHFILRVQDAELAGRLRGWLRESGKESDSIKDIRLLFESRALPPVVVAAARGAGTMICMLLHQLLAADAVS